MLHHGFYLIGRSRLLPERLTVDLVDEPDAAVQQRERRVNLVGALGVELDEALQRSDSVGARTAAIGGPRLQDFVAGAALVLVRKHVVVGQQASAIVVLHAHERAGASRRDGEVSHRSADADRTLATIAGVALREHAADVAHVDLTLSESLDQRKTLGTRLTALDTHSEAVALRLPRWSDAERDRAVGERGQPRWARGLVE